MADRHLTPADMQAIEAMIDRTDAGALVAAVGYICGEKAQHIRENWQDNRLAQEWQRRAGQCERLADTLRRGR